MSGFNWHHSIMLPIIITRAVCIHAHAHAYFLISKWLGIYEKIPWVLSKKCMYFYVEEAKSGWVLFLPPRHGLTCRIICPTLIVLIFKTCRLHKCSIYPLILATKSHLFNNILSMTTIEKNLSTLSSYGMDSIYLWTTTLKKNKTFFLLLQGFSMINWIQ